MPVVFTIARRGSRPVSVRAAQRASPGMRGGVRAGGDRGSPHGKRGEAGFSGPGRGQAESSPLRALVPLKCWLPGAARSRWLASGVASRIGVEQEIEEAP